MEVVVPSLCATSTVGIAAVGLALGHRTPTSDSRSDKRKSSSRFALDEPQSAPPTSRLRKRTSFGRPLSSSSRLSLGAWTTQSIPDIKPSQEPEASEPHATISQASGPTASEHKFDRATKPSWLRRKSTLSMSRDESTASTPPPCSPSISFSNGSTAPILPSTTDHSPATLTRNKLVKRRTSHRALQSRNGMHSSLRRPATSHQRSATLQQYLSEDESITSHQPGKLPIPLSELREDKHNDEGALPSRWRPFFRPQAVRVVKDGSFRKRNATSVVSRAEILKTVVPNVSEIPTLLPGNSITPRSSEDALDRDALYNDNPTPLPRDPESTPRRSFTLSGIFPSPSPSTWKMPRSGSVKKSQGLHRVTDNRRVVSAPHHPGSRQEASIAHSNTNPTSRKHKRRPSESYTNGSNPDSHPLDARRRISSSPLPPLNRLSAFEVDLPNSVPSYPTSPQLAHSSESLRMSSTPPQPASSPLGPLAFNTFRNKSHRPSGAPSDHASTLLGSENSRFLSGDEDDVDGRSETVYDSTRTGATGSSHSGVRRPPIDTVFDELPLPELSKGKLLALQDLMGHDSFTEASIQKDNTIEKPNFVPPSLETTALCKENERPISVHTPINRSPSPELPSSPPVTFSMMESSQISGDHPQESVGDDIWSFVEGGETAERFDKTLGSTSVTGRSNGLRKSSSPSPPALPIDTLTVATEKTSISHLFDWSEQPSSERDSLQGSSPRPKTVHGKNGNDMRGSRPSGRRGPNALHLRSQSVPVPSDGVSHRGISSTSKLETWGLGNKGVSEDWDGDFEFEEPSPRSIKQVPASHEYPRSSSSTGMLVPRSIMERQASVHGQFGQVKELTLLVEELKRLQQQASVQGIMQGQSIELWKEAEGIINLATVDEEEQEFRPPRSPRSSSFDFDDFDDGSPAGRSRRRKSGLSSAREDRSSGAETVSGSDTPLHTPSRVSPEKPQMDGPLLVSRPRKESAAKAKSVLENIHQQRSHYDLSMLEQSSQKKLPFDTTSLRDLVIRAGVVTRALKEIVRQADQSPHTPDVRPTTPPDPPFSHIFQKSQSSPPPSRSPRTRQSPKSGSFMGGTIAGNDNDINGHMKIMTVV